MVCVIGALSTVREKCLHQDVVNVFGSMEITCGCLVVMEILPKAGPTSMITETFYLLLDGIMDGIINFCTLIHPFIGGKMQNALGMSHHLENKL